MSNILDEEQYIVPVLGARLLILGSPGAGKSTFARALAGRMDLPLHHLDALYWAADWQRKYSPEEWREFQTAIVAGDHWIIDGNYYSTLDIRILAADTIIFIDVSPWRALLNIFGRIRNFREGSRPDMANDCPERLDWRLVRTVIRYPFRDRKKVMRLAEKYDKRIIILKSRSETEAFLENI